MAGEEARNATKEAAVRDYGFWEERAAALVNAVVEAVPDGDAEARAYWTVAEGALHFDETELLRSAAPNYDGSADAEAARLAAVLLLRERAERLRGAVESDGDDE